MLKKLRKRLRRQRLAIALFLAAALAAPPSTAGADIGAQIFSDGAAHTVTDNIVSTTAGLRGLWVDNAGTSAEMTGHAIITTGSTLSQGAFARYGGAITLTGVAVTTAGANSAGTYAYEGGTITMNGGSIATTGVASGGAYSFNPGAAITLTDVTIATFAAAASGLGTGSGGTVTTAGGTIAAAGVQGHGATAVDAGSTVTMTGTAVTVTGADAYALWAFSNGTVTASASGQNIAGFGSGGGLIYANAATVSLTASSGSRLYGISTLLHGGTVSLTLNGNAAWTMPGDSTLTNLALSSGSVIFSPPSAGSYKTLAVSGTLAGHGGAFYLNTDLAGGTGDLVSVTGAAGGSHTLYVRNTGGVPADPYQALRVVNLTGASAASFSGGGDVRAYRYAVARGSSLSGYGGVAAGEDYYLYNTFAPSAASRAAMGLSADTVVVWYGELNEIRKRLGDLRMGAPSGDDFWARVYADRYSVRPGGGGGYTQLMRGVEVGRDNPQAFAGGNKYTGFVLGTGKADNTFSAGGKGATNSFYAGAYASWLRDDGAFFDLIGKYNWLSYRFNTPVLGGGSDSGSYRNTGLGLSAELGRRYERKGGAFIEPAVELSALWAGRASYATANGLSVDTPATDSLQLRLGVTAGSKWQGADGAAKQFYGKVSWVNEYKGDSVTRVDSAAFASSLKGHQWVAGLGYIADNGRHQLYIDVEKSWGNTVSKSWGVNAGCRWKF